MVIPLWRARRPASWTTGPSIMGSEKGKPSSIASAPAAATARTTVGQSGEPPAIT